MTLTARLFAPDGLRLRHRVYSPRAGCSGLALAVLVPFELDPPGGGATGPDAWQRLRNALARPDGDTPAPGEAGLDEGWPKPRGEFLLWGAAAPQPGGREPAMTAGVTVGPVHRELERRPALPPGGGTASAATPLQRDEPLQPGTGFGPLPPHRAPRAPLLGPDGDAWLRCPESPLPGEMDPLFFQMADPAQTRDGYWTGGETILLRHLHPRHPEWHGRLPRHRVRLFVQQTPPGEEPCFHELKVHADTVWLLPGAGLGVMIHRGLIPVSDNAASDVGAVLAALEDADEPRLPIERYLQECLRRVDRMIGDGSPLPSEVLEPAALARLPASELGQRLDEQRRLLEDAMARSGTCDAELLRQFEQDPRTRPVARMIRQNGGSVTAFLDVFEELLGETPERPSREPAHARPRHSFYL